MEHPQRERRERRDRPHTMTTAIRGGEMVQDGNYRNRRVLGSGDWLLIYTAEGSGRFVGPKGERVTRSGEMILYAPVDYQEYGTDPQAGTWHLLWVHFPSLARLAPLLQWPVGADGFRVRTLGEEELQEALCENMNRVITLSRRSFSGAGELVVNALEGVLLWSHATLRNREEPELDPRVRKAMDYLITHLCQPFDLKELARYAGVSVSRLLALFKAHTQRSPLQFREHYRMQYACDLLLRTSSSIAEIAFDVGYADPFYFSNRFRHYHGMSPRQFRSLYRDIPSS